MFFGFDPLNFARQNLTLLKRLLIPLDSKIPSSLDTPRVLLTGFSFKAWSRASESTVLDLFDLA